MKPNIHLKSSALLLGLIATFIISMLIAVESREVLPEKYFFDSSTINTIQNSAEQLKTGDSYNNTALFYKILGMSERSTANKILFPALFILSALYILRKIKSDNTAAKLLITSYSCLTAAIYLSQYSKESIVLIICISFIYASGSFLGISLWLITAATYALYFRTYWFITLTLFLAILLAIRKYESIKIALGIISALYFILSITFPAVYGQALGQHRISANENRLGSIDAATIISPIIPGDGWLLDFTNTLIQSVLLLFPIPLATTGNPLHLASFIAISLISWETIKAFKAHTLTNTLKYSLRLQAAYSLLISILAIQAIFEPDYGSYIKHLTPILIILIFIHSHDKRRPQKP